MMNWEKIGKEFCHAVKNFSIGCVKEMLTEENFAETMEEIESESDAFNIENAFKLISMEIKLEILKTVIREIWEKEN